MDSRTEVILKTVLAGGDVSSITPKSRIEELLIALGQAITDISQPSEEEIATAVNNWLTEHKSELDVIPDGSITQEKLSRAIYNDVDSLSDIVSTNTEEISKLNETMADGFIKHFTDDISFSYGNKPQGGTYAFDTTRLSSNKIKLLTGDTLTAKNGFKVFLYYYQSETQAYADNKQVASWISSVIVPEYYNNKYGIIVIKADDNRILSEYINNINDCIEYTFNNNTEQVNADNVSVNYSSIKNKWAGKKAVFLGDSITVGISSQGNVENKYYDFIAEYLRLSAVVGYGVGGSSISSQSDYGTTKSAMVTRYLTMDKDADMVVVFGGTNDYGHSTPLGSIEDDTDISFYGALNVLITGLIENYVGKRIIFMTPLHRIYSSLGETTDNDTNAIGYRLIDYVDAIKDVCKKYSVPVVDTYSISGLTPAVEIIKSTYMEDGLHPNQIGHKLLAENIWKEFENL